ncbi:histidine kinase [Bifidobacterium bombi]|uniref:Two-component sensor, histidine kinase n=1 Tax=Bifidobacterium bombi DSM 19703 TaxID=1341695 RepID=A0A080N2I9_9BIFI|nr:histidine kinase [Bifidobacterium bombi]KFF31046.1 two-component sensor, histidine kinase [Bifidobacterium bombi DSM 19703]
MSIRTQARTDWDTPARRFPNYASMMFILGFVFIIPDSAYVGNFALLLLQPALIIGLYIAMRKLPNLLSQRAAALLLIATCIWAAPYLRHGGHLLTYIVIAEASLLFNEVFGYVTILISACVIWTISPILNMLSSYRSGEFKIASLYVLFAGIVFMVFTSQNTKLQQANEKLEDDMHTIESLTLSRERARMASEMHDSLGQQLSAVHYAHESALRMLNHVEESKNAEAGGVAAAHGKAHGETCADRSNPDFDAIRSSIARADDITRESLTEVRQMARALSPTAFGQRLDRTTIERMAAPPSTCNPLLPRHRAETTWKPLILNFSVLT